ncbi:MAG: transcriptional regulator GcvA [Hyphomicrobiales bacterium]|nr:transcriptional regulator GcvA [Hyphomicrobiales bacterium]MCP5373749.1 transcriptional regulator GcvA [Hyphomicrobiales bacterium]
MRRIPSTAGLVAFEAASRLLSFQRAAEELNVTPGAVSRQIQALEAFLGTALFRRRHKRVELTPAGRQYAAEVREPLDRLSGASERLRGEARGNAVSICAYPTFAIRWFIPRWGRFFDAHPQIDVRLTTSLNPADFEGGEYDMAIQVLGPEGPRRGLEARKLAEVDTFPVCAPALAETLKSPADLARHTLLHGAPRPQDWRQWLREAEIDGIDPTRGLRFESHNLTIQAAIEGLGVAIGVGVLVEADLAQGRLVRPFATVRRSGRPFHLVYPQAKAEDPNLVALRDWLLQEASA